MNKLGKGIKISSKAKLAHFDRKEFEKKQKTQTQNCDELKFIKQINQINSYIQQGLPGLKSADGEGDDQNRLHIEHIFEKIKTPKSKGDKNDDLKSMTI